ncbi:hypothetical protein E4U44_004551 [Claviceps purpurea]|nr:hypothetical protein E4U44_004551 [Claviceps purpurea]
MEVGTELRAGIKIRQALRDHLEAHGFVSKSSYSSVSTLRSLISYDGLFSNISTKTPSPRTLSAKKNGPPMPLKNLSIALPITPSTTTKQTSLMKILLTPRLNAQLRTLNPDKKILPALMTKTLLILMATTMYDVNDSDNLDGKEPARDLRDNDITSLVSTETHNEENNLPLARGIFSC